MQIFLIKALQLIVALSLLVIIHEFGHYIFARMFGMKVNRFYMFFNPWFSLLKYYPDKGEVQLIAWTEKIMDPTDPEKKRVKAEVPHALLTCKVRKYAAVGKNGKPTWAATLYGLGWLPLGGYCDIDGMVDETKSADSLPSTPQPWEFRSKPAWQRFLVMFAGVLFNFILAIIIYTGIALHWGDKVVPYHEAYEGMDYVEPLLKAGYRNGDILLSVNGHAIDAKDRDTFWDMIQPGAKVEVLRDHSDTITITTPQWMLDSMLDVKSSIMSYRIPAIVDDTQNGMPAKRAGLEKGDRIVKVGADTTPSLTEFYRALDANKGKTTAVTVLRAEQALSMDVDVTDDGKLGILLRPLNKIYPIETVKYSIFSAIPRGWELGTTQLSMYVSSLKTLFTKSGIKQVGGFGTMGSIFPEKWDWHSFWEITAFLSVILAFMNFLPIPMLDGGYILFLLWEIVTRHKVPDRFLEVANTIGLVFLVLLMVYANANDVIRALGYSL